MLETSEAAVNSLLRRTRAAFETRLPATGRERAPLPNSKRERDIVGRLAVVLEEVGSSGPRWRLGVSDATSPKEDTG
jgi:hypothetical protein